MGESIESTESLANRLIEDLLHGRLIEKQLSALGPDDLRALRERVSANVDKLIAERNSEAHGRNIFDFVDRANATLSLGLRIDDVLRGDVEEDLA